NVPTPGSSNQSGTSIEENRFVSSFSLVQNYPNPFNASTMIEYNLTEKGVVQINILNITGQLIRTLYSGEQPAGEYRLRWDATDQGSGIYFCELWTDAHRYMMKMMLLK
ncbi:T9SS type A sorting domain-containing protein, partial [bacterium]|nr:T9SS type A sorting domain-containing protein [bacterium]